MVTLEVCFSVENVDVANQDSFGPETVSAVRNSMKSLPNQAAQKDKQETDKREIQSDNLKQCEKVDIPNQQNNTLFEIWHKSENDSKNKKY